MSDTFFGVQAAFRVPAGAPLRSGLAEVVQDLRGRRDLPSQRAAWQRHGALMRDHLGWLVLGDWDLLRRQPEEAYEEWASDLEAMATWPAGDFGAGGDLLLVTVIALVAGGSNADRTIGDLCDVPEKLWHRRDTFRSLLTAMPLLNLTGVRGAGLYVAPHPQTSGFAMEVLRGEGFEYLRPIA